ncbi:dTDP-glucose 4,6-dehydratase [Candidatus Falkowbacteria bacterium RIFOXYC2_FULL_47_12]|uniref:dTDP-glucose 4,6-dehydratase n=2 Tax=Candidatus Falkowiibacteriota TaxID=1752728 RepID=A0A1F5TQS8_9BACT|nr:MAG: dTDP-glucose 4,6-dehydratase [Candidatus Falkowbacteria bacterium RIFOXYA2_FULL_47_9]OGF41320.1 MAG: dTDP-glucose 4,6-dehydratase [Candidatus Falkowbacteria bacterium RIFOXYC2_FULL_47_12]
MKLLITGGCGFIGSNFIYYWLKKYQGDKIVNLDALTYAGNVDNLKDLPNRQNYEFVLGNICDPQIVDEVMKETELVVHFAAESHVDNSIVDSTPFVKTNVLGTQVLLDAALKNGKKRFHHISTDEVFGSLGPNDPPFNENTPYDPRSPYSASKAAADHLVRAYWHTHQLPITISNCSNNYGPHQHKEKLIPLFITNLLQNKKVPVYGTGQNIRDWLYVDDHCSAIDAIISRGKIGETYLIGGKGNKEKEITNLELAKKLIELLGRDESLIEYVTDRPGHDFRYAIDDHKIRTELEWQPQINFEEGLKKTIEWYKI